MQQSQLEALTSRFKKATDREAQQTGPVPPTAWYANYCVGPEAGGGGGKSLGGNIYSKHCQIQVFALIFCLKHFFDSNMQQYIIMICFVRIS